MQHNLILHNYIKFNIFYSSNYLCLQNNLFKLSIIKCKIFSPRNYLLDEEIKEKDSRDMNVVVQPILLKRKKFYLLLQSCLSPI